MSLEQKLTEDTVRGFLAEPLIPLGIKLSVYLPVVLGIRQASQMVMPAQLPDAEILGATIDEMYKRKIKGRRLPGESLGSHLKGKLGKRFRRSALQEVQYRAGILRDQYKEIVEGSHSYMAFEGWVAKLGLRLTILESRPTIRELFLYTDEEVDARLQELRDFRKDIRYRAMRTPSQSTDVFARAFPEEFNAGFLRARAEILGFPSCCVDRFVFDRTSGVLSPEVRAASQLESAPEGEIDPFAYPTDGFIPCQPDCPNAAELGRKIQKGLSDLELSLGEQYENELFANVKNVRKFPEAMQQRQKVLEEAAKTREQAE